MTDFHDIRFPTRLAFGASGGPVRRTDILQLASGGEARNTPHAFSRRRYNAVSGLKSQAEASELIAFFESRLGALHAFRFRDPLDHATAESVSATDVLLGLGDGERTVFQLAKAYGIEPYVLMRPLTKPVVGTVRVAVDAVEIDTAINYLTGKVTFETPPPTGARVTAGCEFDVPVRFAMDHLDIVLSDFAATRIDDIPLIEVLDHV
jgi:uncharacterized protein (TIGR02217 family)